LAEFFDFPGVDIDTSDQIAAVSEACSGNQADITGPNDRDFHDPLPFRK
jgi:hypothetical protein